MTFLLYLVAIADVVGIAAVLLLMLPDPKPGPQNSCRNIDFSAMLED